MRFLFSVHPAHGHFHAMAPLAQALQDAGHQVAFATGKGFGPAVRRAGFQHFPCGLDYDGATDILQALPEWPDIQARVPASLAVQQFHGFVEGLGPRMADDLIGLARAWKPGVIVRDPLEFGGYIAAEVCGLPHATVLWAFYISAKAACPEAILELRQRYALPDDPGLDTLDSYLALDFLPPSWAFPGLAYPPATHRFCAPPFDLGGGARPPDWMEALPHRPSVYATLGTTFNQSPATFQAILSALRGEPINLIVTVGRSMDPAQFGPQPEHVKIEQFIPQTLLLPHCDALIFHGGYNTLLAALWHGLPMVVIPMEAGDQWPTAQRCAGLGVGMLLEGSPPEPEAIRAAVKRALEEPGYRARARQLQREIKALPGLPEAVRRLEILATTRAPQLNDKERGLGQSRF
jgi:UDP:flavonoid glycosyltransferase YjiC (YdhE family)